MPDVGQLKLRPYRPALAPNHPIVLTPKVSHLKNKPARNVLIFVSADCVEYVVLRNPIRNTGTVEHPQMRLALQALQARMERLQRGKNSISHFPDTPQGLRALYT